MPFAARNTACSEERFGKASISEAALCSVSAVTGSPFAISADANSTLRAFAATPMPFSTSAAGICWLVSPLGVACCSTFSVSWPDFISLTVSWRVSPSLSLTPSSCTLRSSAPLSSFILALSPLVKSTSPLTESPTSSGLPVVCPPACRAGSVKVVESMRMGFS